MKLRLLLLVMFFTLIAAGCQQGTVSTIATPMRTVISTATTGIPNLPRGWLAERLAFQGILKPAPNGQIAVSVTSDEKMRFMTLDGAQLGTYQASALMQFSWLADSTGVLLWSQTGAGEPTPTLVVDIHGTARPIGFNGFDPVVSPDGVWIASDTSFHGTLQVARKSGGAVTTLAQNSSGLLFIGWLGDSIIYDANNTIYAVAPTGGTPRALGNVTDPINRYEPATTDTTATAPDGQALMLLGSGRPSYIITEKHMYSDPEPAPNIPTLWVEQHTIIANTPQSNHIRRIDAVSGSVTDTDIALPAILAAVNGAWVATQGDAVYLTNLSNGKTYNLGPSPVNGALTAFAGGKFFLAGQNLLFFIDPELLM